MNTEKIKVVADVAFFITAILFITFMTMYICGFNNPYRAIIGKIEILFWILWILIDRLYYRTKYENTLKP